MTSVKNRQKMKRHVWRHRWRKNFVVEPTRKKAVQKGRRYYYGRWECKICGDVVRFTTSKECVTCYRQKSGMERNHFYSVAKNKTDAIHKGIRYYKGNRCSRCGGNIRINFNGQCYYCTEGGS